MSTLGSCTHDGISTCLRGQVGDGLGGVGGGDRADEAEDLLVRRRRDRDAQALTSQDPDRVETNVLLPAPATALRTTPPSPRIASSASRVCVATQLGLVDDCLVVGHAAAWESVAGLEVGHLRHELGPVRPRRVDGQERLVAIAGRQLGEPGPRPGARQPVGPVGLQFERDGRAAAAAPRSRPRRGTRGPTARPSSRAPCRAASGTAPRTPPPRSGAGGVAFRPAPGARRRRARPCPPAPCRPAAKESCGPGRRRPPRPSYGQRRARARAAPAPSGARSCARAGGLARDGSSTPCGACTRRGRR